MGARIFQTPGAWLRQGLRDRRGSAAVEFALVSGLFLTALLFAICLLLVIFLQQQLDRATDVAARQIMNGSVQKGSYTGPTFQKQFVCANLPAFMACSDVIVNAWSVTPGSNPGGYYAFVNSAGTGLTIPPLSSSSAQFGVQGSYEYLQVIYPITFLPSLLINLFSTQTYNGAPAYLTVSTAAFRNEQY